jgi:hypothetical protein
MKCITLYSDLLRYVTSSPEDLTGKVDQLGALFAVLS